MRQEKKHNDKTATILVLCFCLIALVCIFAVKSSIDKVKNNLDVPDTTKVVKEQAVEKNAVQNDEVQADEIVDSLQDDDDTDKQATVSKYILPLDGEIIMPFSVDVPIYWETLDQYMTHGGIDISGETGENIIASAGGTITNIQNDDKFGTIMEINHGNGVITRYGNLSGDGLRELGEVVARGEIIGKIGQSSLYEFNSPPHLHFEFIKEGMSVNPSEYIAELE